MSELQQPGGISIEQSTHSAMGGNMWTRTGVVFTTPRHRLMIKVAGTSCVLDNSSGSHLDTFTPTNLLRRAPGPMAPFCGWWQQRAAAGF